MLRCASAPTIPDDGEDQSLAAYIVNLWGAWFDCSSKLKAVEAARGQQ